MMVCWCREEAGQGEEEMEESLGGPQEFGYIRSSSIHCEYKVTVSHHASKELIKRITSKIETPSEFYMVSLEKSLRASAE